MAQMGSASRTADRTEAHKCRSCGKAFWANSSWNGVTVTCPHCNASN